jgi:hypothetical protein
LKSCLRAFPAAGVKGCGGLSFMKVAREVETKKISNRKCGIR